MYENCIDVYSLGGSITVSSNSRFEALLLSMTPTLQPLLVREEKKWAVIGSRPRFHTVQVIEQSAYLQKRMLS